MSNLCMQNHLKYNTKKYDFNDFIIFNDVFSCETFYKSRKQNPIATK